MYGINSIRVLQARVNQSLLSSLISSFDPVFATVASSSLCSLHAEQRQTLDECDPPQVIHMFRLLVRLLHPLITKQQTWRESERHTTCRQDRPRPGKTRMRMRDHDTIKQTVGLFNYPPTKNSKRMYALKKPKEVGVTHALKTD